MHHERPLLNLVDVHGGVYGDVAPPFINTFQARSNKTLYQASSVSALLGLEAMRLAALSVRSNTTPYTVLDLRPQVLLLSGIPTRNFHMRHIKLSAAFFPGLHPSPFAMSPNPQHGLKLKYELFGVIPSRTVEPDMVIAKVVSVRQYRHLSATRSYSFPLALINKPSLLHRLDDA